MYDGDDGAWIECRLFECFCPATVASVTSEKWLIHPANPRVPSNYRPAIVILSLLGHSRALN
jgi:hypothetical protein